MLFDTATAKYFVKVGGSSNQYLMADGTVLSQSANSGNSNFYLYQNLPTSLASYVPGSNVSGQVIYSDPINPSASTDILISNVTFDGIDVSV